MRPTLGILGGSGIYTLEGLEEAKTLEISTPFGDPSAAVVVGLLSGESVAFISRRGGSHQFLASEIRYRANIYALKSLGVDRVVSVSALLSLRSDFEPGHLVIPEQLLDFTTNRARTFFGQGLVAEVDMAHPFCSQLATEVYQAATQTDARVHLGGTLITLDGPRTATIAESDLYRGWGVSTLNTTTCPEAFLAREAEMCYAVLGHIVRYDRPHPSPSGKYSDTALSAILESNQRVICETLKALVVNLPQAVECPHQSALSGALRTPLEDIPPATLRRLDALLHKYTSPQ